MNGQSSTFRAEAKQQLPPQNASTKEEDGWGFEEEATITEPAALEHNLEEIPDTDEGGWGFEDEDPEPEANNAEDAWGLDETNGVEDSSDEPVWDAWDDPPPATNGKVPKTAKRLEKFSNKGKTLTEHNPTLSITVPGKPPELQRTIPEPGPRAEFYVVSTRMKELKSMVEDVLQEAGELSHSKLFASFPAPPTPPGTLIFQTAPSVLDLFRALYPVSSSSDLSKSMKFSNDCLWLSDEVRGMFDTVHFTRESGVKEKLNEAREKLEVFGRSWFEQTIVSFET